MRRACPCSREASIFRELEGLPAPVGRYFRLVLNEGQPMVSGVRVRHTGTFNAGEAEDQWKPFASDQVLVTHRDRASTGTRAWR
jgi:hypothetical protein